MNLIPNTDFVSISPRITTRRVTGIARYSKRDGTYQDYDRNAEGNHNFSSVYRMVAKAEQSGLFADALDSGARSVCRVNSQTVVSFDPTDNIARIGWTTGGVAYKYEMLLNII
jgi:hypothetical protein